MRFYQNIENLFRVEKFEVVEVINTFYDSRSVLAQDVRKQFIEFLTDQSFEIYLAWRILENYIKDSLERNGSDASNDIFASLKQNFITLKTIISEDFSFFSKKDIIKIFEYFLEKKGEFLEKNIVEEYAKKPSHI